MARQRHSFCADIKAWVALEAFREQKTIDITYIRLAHKFGYLVAIMDWFSHYVFAWRLPNSMNPIIAWKHCWMKPWNSEHQPSLLPTKELSSRAWNLPVTWGRKGCRSLWMGADTPWTTSLWSVSSRALSGKTSHS